MPHCKKEMISFFMTTRCNLDCVYCYTNKNNYSDQTIDLDFCKVGIDYYFSLPYEKHLRFFGAGEPTIELQKMKIIIEYAKNKTDEKIVVETQTNGAFKDTTAQWLAKNLDIIWISCDGTPDIQNKYKPLLNGGPSSPLIEKNIKYLINESNAMTGIRMTITSGNLYRQTEIIDYFYSMGIRNIWCDPIFPSIGEKKAFDDFDLMVFAKEFTEASKFAEKINVFYGSILTCNFDEDTIYHCRACIPVPHLTTDGYISACDMAMFGKDTSPMSVFIYGEWDKDNKKIVFDDRKIKNLRARNINNLSHCQNCDAKYHCGGYCLGEVTNETGDLYGCKNRVCEPIRFLNKTLTQKQKTYKYTHP